MPDVMRDSGCPGPPDCAECVAIERARTVAEERQRACIQRTETARRTLLSIIDGENRRRLAEERRVIVTGSHGGRYAVHIGYSGNVYRLDATDHPTVSFCAHPHMYDGAAELPMHVAMITQILAIQDNEPGFLEIANAGY